MAQARCRFFNENGNPRDGGCYRAGQCNFIHPDDPAWETAHVGSFTRGHGMGRGGSFGESRGSFTRGRGRGSAPVNSYNSSLALGCDTGGGLRTALTLESSKRPMATINDRIDKIKILRSARAEARAQRAKLPPPKIDMPPEATGAIEDVSRKATELSAALDAPINDIEQLLIRQNEIQQTQASLKTENEELRESIAKLTETSAANRKLIQEQTEAIQRLKASLEAVSESRHTPPPAEPPIKVMYDDLRGAVDDAVQVLISREVIPTMIELTDQCRSENKRIHREVFEIIWDLVEPGLKITEAVNRWVTSLELPAS